MSKRHEAAVVYAAILTAIFTTAMTILICFRFTSKDMLSALAAAFFACSFTVGAVLAIFDDGSEEGGDDDGEN